MNEEEKKAFEELSKKAVLCNYEERDYPNMICFKKDMLIVLNLIEKLQKENEELKENDNKYTIQLTDEQYNNVIEIVQNDINQKWIRKVKDKIEILEKLQKEFLNNEELRIKIIAYKELIEEREEKENGKNI